MAYPDDLPTCVDGSLGQTKVNTSAYDSKTESADADEYNEIKSSVEGLAAIVGMPDGSTAGSILEKLAGLPDSDLADLISSGALTNPQEYSADAVLADDSSYWTVSAGAGYGLPTQTVPTVRILHAVISFYLSPFGYPTTGTVNGGAAGAAVEIPAGLHLVVSAGDDVWGVIPFAGDDNVLVSGHSALSVIGRAGNSTGDAADIAAATDNHILRRSGNAIAFGQIIGDGMANNTVGNAQIRQSVALSVVGRATNTTGDVADVIASADRDVLHRSGTSLVFGAPPAASASFPGSMSAAHYTAVENLIDVADPLSAFPSHATIAVMAGLSDFLVSSTGAAPYLGAATGTAAVVNWGTGAGSRVGILQCDTGTTTTGVVAVYTASGGLALGSGRFRFRSDINVPLASDGTETFTVRAGLSDAFSVGGSGIDGVFFRYSHSVNSGNWVCVTRSNSVETLTNTAVAGVHATAYSVLEIEVNAAGNSVLFYIDGVLVATHVANIPTGAGRELGISVHILKSAGTTSRSLNVDLMAHRYERTAAI
jgi:hypothetical protein